MAPRTTSTITPMQFVFWGPGVKMGLWFCLTFRDRLRTLRESAGGCWFGMVFACFSEPNRKCWFGYPSIEKHMDTSKGQQPAGGTTPPDLAPGWRVSWTSICGQFQLHILPCASHTRGIRKARLMLWLMLWSLPIEREDWPGKFKPLACHMPDMVFCFRY